MTLLRILLLFNFLMVFAFSTNIQAQTAKHVILISIDGFRPDFYMDNHWNAPILKSLKKKGVYAADGIKGVFPSVTFPSHTTLVTGVNPMRHGIYYNRVPENDNGRWYWEKDSIKVKTLWDGVKEAGMTSSAVLWPVTVNAPIDYNFPDRWPATNEEGNRLSSTLQFTTPKNLIDGFDKARGKKLSNAELATDEDYKIDKSITELSSYIIKNYKPNFMAIHLLRMDSAEHKYGREGPEINAALVVVDSLIGEIFDAIKEAKIEESTVVIITGDHGFADTRAYFSPNIYLAQHGLITDEGWKAKFIGGGAGFLVLKDKNDEATLNKVKEILADIPKPQRNLFRIFDRPQLDEMGVDPNVSLVLSTEEGIYINDKTTGAPYEPVKGKRGSHGYDPAYPHLYTGFIATGAGIAKDKNITDIGSMSIKDVTPLIAEILGLSMENIDGALIPYILDK